MAAATQDTKSTPTQQRAVLASLTQQAAAALIGRPTIYFRDHAHEIPRNPDGTYDGPAVVRWALGQVDAAALPDELLEPVLQTVDWVAPRDDDDATAFRALDAVVRQFGGAGLAAIGELIYRQVKANHEALPEPKRELPTREKFEAELVEQARQQAADQYPAMQDSHARRTGKLVATCGCGKWRQGRTWHKTSIPHGYHACRYKTDCPDCIARVRRA